MMYLENWTLSDIQYYIPFYYRYVDNIVLCLSSFEIEFILEKFNSFHPRLQFTLELDGNSINFLDTIIMLKNNSLVCDWYQKPTFSNRYLNFLSQHPISLKKAITNLIDKVFISRIHNFTKKILNLL